MPIQTAIDSINNNQGSPFGFKNRIINGAMVIDQRNAGASVSIDGTAPYTLDRYLCQDNTDGSFSVQQSSTAPTGFNNSLLVTITGTDSSLTTTQFGRIVQRIEGYNIADLGWGTASAQTVTLSFWVRSSVTGTFSGVLNNSAGDRLYAFTYTINAANTFEYKTITIAGDTTGTWLTTNGTGIELNLSIGAGPSRTVAAGAWGTSLAYAATGQTNLFATASATWYITGVQLEKGSTATSFDYRPYGTELALCQRYYEVLGYGCIAMAETGTTYVMNLPYRVTKRAAASIGLTITSNLRVRQFGVADRDAATPVASSVASSTTGGTFKVTGFAAIGSASTPAGIGYTTTSEDGNAFFASAEL